jgi:hypothetical protein
MIKLEKEFYDIKKIEIEYNNKINNEINNEIKINNNKQLKRINSREDNIYDLETEEINNIEIKDIIEKENNKEYRLIEDIEEIYYNNDGIEIIINFDIDFKKIKFNKIILSKKLLKYKKDIFITDNNKIFNINEYIINNNSKIKIHLLFNNKLINNLYNQFININYSITNFLNKKLYKY